MAPKTNEAGMVVDHALTSAEKLVIDKKTYQELMTYLVKLENKKKGLPGGRGSQQSTNAGGSGAQTATGGMMSG